MNPSALPSIDSKQSNAYDLLLDRDSGIRIEVTYPIVNIPIGISGSFKPPYASQIFKSYEEAKNFYFLYASS